jgi:hypothetical protein
VEEEQLLRRSLGKPSAFDRDDITSVVTMLRCGIGVDAARFFAPGMRVSALAGAYDHVDNTRAQATTDWHRLLEDPCGASAETILSAERILPSGVRRILAARPQGADAVHAAVEQVVAVLERRWREVGSVEEALHLGGTAVGVLLVDPWRPSLWDRPDYMPRRVTDLSPRRLRDLLGERYPEHPLPVH